MILVIAPEGTRSAAPHWKSGFLKIAQATGAPLVLAGVDYEGKRVVIGPAVTFDGDTPSLMEVARDFYSEMSGLHRDLEGPVRVREES